MLGNNIVLTPNPLGRWIDGVVGSASILPGTCISPQNVAPDAGGRLTWLPWQHSTGFQGLIAIADVDWNQGFTPQNPGYQVGRRFPVYLTVPGDELNMLLAELAGTTGDPAINIGDQLAPQTLTGQLIKTAAGTAGGTWHAFEAWEQLAVALGQEWVHVVRV